MNERAHATDSIRATIELPQGAVVVRAEARFVSKLNVEATYGRPWRWLLDLLPELRSSGMEILGTRKAPMVRASDLDAFLRTRAAATVAAADPPDHGPKLDEVDALLARGGTVRRRAGSRR